MKMICQRFHIITLFAFWDILTWDIWNVCLQTYRNNRICYKIAYFFKKMQTSLVNNSRNLKIKNVKFSGYCFYMNPNIYWNFLICISVRLKDDFSSRIDLSIFSSVAPLFLDWSNKNSLIFLALKSTSHFLPQFHSVSWIRFKFRSQFKLLPQIGCPITLRIESSIISIDRNITDNIIREIINDQKWSLEERQH